MDLLIWIIIGANVAVSIKALNDAYFFSKYEFRIGAIAAGEQLRMLTSGFLHADFMHLAFNMFTLYFFAPTVLAHINDMYFVFLYLGSLVGGNLLTLYFYKNNPGYRAVGASGAVMGVVYAAILLEPNMSLYFYFIPIPIPGYVFGVGYLLYSIYGMKNKRDNIGHAAHFGGAIMGYLLIIMQDLSILTTNTKMVVLLLIPIAVLWYMYKNDKL